MAIQKFSLIPLQKVRQYIRTSLALPDTETSQAYGEWDSPIEEPPEPESVDDLSGLFSFGGIIDPDMMPSGIREAPSWVLSTVNPGSTLLKLPGLKLKPGLRLVSYVHRSEESGVGIVWAVPEDLSTTAQLEKALITSRTVAQVPKPTGALSSVMEAIDGDRSSVSFMVASILRRELQEFGARGCRCNWSHHQLIETIPPELNWTWRAEQPRDFSPKVKLLVQDKAAVEFFTYRTTEAPTIYRHVDQYPAGSYKHNSLDQSIAVAK